MRSLKGLAGIISISVVHWFMGEDGWTFEPGPDVIPDTVNGVLKLHQLYRPADPGCTSRVTVPVLWDKNEGTIVSNESANILRMFNSAFDDLGAKEGDYYPSESQAEIAFPLVTNQFEYHPYLNQSLVIDAARKAGLAVTAYCAMAVGRALPDYSGDRQ
jgi:glutathionyl-hydroquinone reductase